MSVRMSLPAERAAGLRRAKNYLTASYGVRSWLLTTDHKRIGDPVHDLDHPLLLRRRGRGHADAARADDARRATCVQPETYNKLFTLHGVVMVFFFLVPSIPAVLGNFLVPIMIGARDLAFPKINLLSWYIYIARRPVHALRRSSAGGVDTGWTFYTPYSIDVLEHATSSLAAMGVFIVGFSSILTGLNFIVTVHKMRAPGMTWFRLPLFVWAMYATSLILVLGTPVLAITILLLGAGAGAARSASSTRPWAATRSCSSTCSGSTRTRRSTS